MVFLGLGVLGAGSVAACAKARAETVPDGPPLAMPAPPERALAPVEAPLVASPVPEPEPTPPVAAAPRTPPRPAPAPKPQTVPPAAQVAPPPRAPGDTRELRPASPAGPVVSERSVREILARAARDLGRVNYGRLSTDGRTQYEQSKRFGTQAEEALRERNLVFAATLADKAATLAAELLQR